jgi:hypothetical protein
MTVPTTEEEEDVFDDSDFVGWYVWTDLSFSFSQLLHFHSTASLQSEQYSVATISPPQALHSIIRFCIVYLLFKRLYVPGTCTTRLCRLPHCHCQLEAGEYVFAPVPESDLGVAGEA